MTDPDLAALRRLAEALRQAENAAAHEAETRDQFRARMQLVGELAEACAPAALLSILDLLDEKDRRIASAEAALRCFSDAEDDLADNESGAIWENPAAMSIECADLRSARAHFTTWEDKPDVEQS